jgi:hypothetical protein
MKEEAKARKKRRTGELKKEVEKDNESWRKKQWHKGGTKETR